MALQLQWNLESTSGSIFHVARGVLQAATSDNVQPLTIMACERFGATLFMCDATRWKIERLVAVTPKPGVISFLQATVGFSANDCASYLSKSFAGIQFLGLAASLITTLTTYESASAVELMLRESTADKTMLPTRRQVQDLLTSLQPRCQTVGFANSVVGWQIVLSRILLSDDDYLKFSLESQGPPTASIAKLVDLMRQMYRIGPSSRVRAVIRPSTCAPWTIAFIEWCRGIAPSVVMSDGRTALLSSDSLITVVVPTGTCSERTFDIEIYQSLASLAEVFRSEPHSTSWEGLVDFDTYAKWRLEIMRFHTSEALEALVEICPYLLYRVVTETKFHSEYWRHREHLPDFTHPCLVEPSAEGIRGTIPSPFPSNTVIARVLSRFLNRSDTYKLGPLRGDAIILNLPLMSSYLTGLARACRCRSCTSASPLNHGSCKREIFIYCCSKIVADILSLSLFHCPEKLLFCYTPFRRFEGSFHPENMDRIVEAALAGRGPRLGSIGRLVDHALRLVDHPQTENNWVMSCYKGQAIYPLIFDTLSLVDYGYLTLGWMRGTLQYDGETYTQVLATKYPPEAGLTANEPIFEEELEIQTGTKPSNFYADLRSIWRVRGSEHFLSADLCLSGATRKFEPFIRNPMNMLLNLGSCIVAESCPHGPRSPLSTTYPRCSYTGLVTLQQHRKPEEEPGEGSIGIVAVDNNESLRAFALSTSELKSGCAKYSIVIL